METMWGQMASWLPPGAGGANEGDGGENRSDLGHRRTELALVQGRSAQHPRPRSERPHLGREENGGGRWALEISDVETASPATTWMGARGWTSEHPGSQASVSTPLSTRAR